MIPLNGKDDMWELEDAVQRQADAPDLYVAPSEADLSRIQTDDRVQLLFLIRGADKHGSFLQSERLWVAVCSVSREGFTGTLESCPNSSNELPPGETISFESRHIAAIRNTHAEKSCRR